MEASEAGSVVNNILYGLNEKQVEAVTTINGPLQIIAGAGSGKTRVLTHRIAYLIEQGIQPYNILALTFTNKAAREMQSRIAQLVDEFNAKRIWAGTFHSIFARILRVEADKIGYDRNFTIYDQEASLRALKTVMKRLNIPKETKENAVASVISSAKNMIILPDKYGTQASSKFEHTVAECYRSYQAYLLKNNAMDFDDLLVNMLRILHIPELLAKYQDKFHYILIDEYQDTNKVQYSAIKELAKHRQNISVVGDDAQSIYKWRGADITNILNFENDYPYCKTVKLEQNYRSTKNILGCADSVILHNKQQLHKHLWTDNPDGDKVKLMKFYDDREEANTVASIINRRYIAGDQLNQFAVLYRTNAQSLAFENACRAYNLPYIVVGGFSFYKRAEVNDVLAYLRLLVNPRDDGSLLRVINEPPRGIGAASIEEIRNYADRKSMPMYDALYFADDYITKRKQTAIQAKRLYNIFQKHRQLVIDNAEPEHLIEYIQETGITDYYKEIDTDEANDKLRNIEQLLTELFNHIRDAEGRTLSTFLEQVSLISDLDAKELAEDRITLMTLHSAKGLEYDNVFIGGLEQELFPLTSARMRDDEEEERRLFYVGITRARKNLVITYTENRLKFGSIQRMLPSLFLREIDEEFLEDVTGNTILIKKRQYQDLHINQVKSSIPQKKQYPAFDDMQYSDNYSQIPTKPSYPSAGSNAFRTGDVVKHDSFGVGKIVMISGMGDNLKATIQFANVGRKQLLMKFAKLQLVEN